MAGLLHLLRCVGKAVVKNGGKALCSLVPFGEVAFEIARDAYADYRKDHSEADLRTDLERLAQTGQAEVRHAAEAVAAQEAADHPAENRLALVSYLNQMPASIRQSLRRPSDPGGATVPPGLSLQKPEDLLPFLPTALPRFKPGDRPLAADWELVELLGKGGFGEVWKARHLTRSRQKPVALKFCLDPVAAATLRNEAALHDHLDRVREEASAPGIVPLLETYLRSDPPCLMYEFIEGGDLAGFVHEMQAQDRLTPEFATRIIYRLASIVAVAHPLDPPLVHRDLKLSNILVRQGDGHLPDLFVADFGIGGLAAGQALREQAGRRVMSSQLLPTAIRGAYTPLYASPQQVRGERPDPRDDVHALGVIWYQLVTGDLRLLAIPPDWRDVVEERSLDKELVPVLASCLASRAEKRPVDAADLAARLADCQSAFQFDPKNALFYYNRGIAWLEKEEYDNAIKDFNKAIRLDPNKASAYYNRGTACLDKKDYDNAIKDLNEAIRLDPNYASAYNNRGMAWLGKKDYDEATKDLNEAIRLDPNYAAVITLEGGRTLGQIVPNFDFIFWLVRGISWLNKKDYDKSFRDFNEAIRLNPTVSLPFFHCANAWLDKKKYDKAVKDYDAAIQLDPEFEAAYNNRGMAWLGKKDYDEAIKDFNKAIQLDPEFADAYRILAWQLATCPEAKYRDGKRAIELATKACDLTEWKGAEALNALAAAYAEAGQFDEAERFQTKALESLPPFDDRYRPLRDERRRRQESLKRIRDIYRQRLELYKQKKPYRECP